MKARKIWIAQHPELPDVFEVSFNDKSGESTYLYSYRDDIDDAVCVEFKEYVMIEVEEP